MRAYAATSDLPTFTPPLADAQGWIERASTLVEEATLLDTYDVDVDDMPAEQRVIDAFRDAVVEQVKFWRAVGVDPFVGVLGQTPEVTSQSTDGGSVSYSPLRSAEELAKAASTLCPVAQGILRAARLGDANGKPFLW